MCRVAAKSWRLPCRPSNPRWQTGSAPTWGPRPAVLPTACCRTRRAHVYAIDVGKGILHWKLRQDARVVVMEETNARFVERLPEAVSLVTIDASFISLKVILPVTLPWFCADEAGQIIALIKPQFEAGRSQVARGSGVIRDPLVHQQILQDMLDFSARLGLSTQGLIRSPLLGPKGNTEFLAYFLTPPTTRPPAQIDLDLLCLPPENQTGDPSSRSPGKIAD